MSLAIRPARPEDGALLFELVRELADYEKLLPELSSTAKDIADALFEPQPRVFADIAEWEGKTAGFAVWFLNFSTFRGRYSIYLEDLFVRPVFRRHGIGKALMKRLAGRCVEKGYGRFEWAVLDWNEPAIAFYRSIGAQIKGEWKLCRLDGEALAAFAGAAR